MSEKLLYINEPKGSVAQSYYVATQNQKLNYQELSTDIATHICIVGAGYTGLSTAIHLRKLGYEVVVLEAQRVGFGASGRNGGQVGIGQRLEQDTLESKLGLDVAKKYWQLAIDTQNLVESLIKDNNIECDYHKGIVYTDHKARFSKGSKNYVADLANKYNYEHIEYLDKNQTAEYVGSEAYYSAIYDRGAAHLHPLNYCLGLAKVATDLGVKIYEQTEVVGYKQNQQIKQGQKGQQSESTITTAFTVPTETKEIIVNVANDEGQLSVKCEKLVLACNGYIGELGNLTKPKISHYVMPINNYVVATEPLSDEVFNSILKDNVAVADSKFVVNYFRKSFDNRLIFGGKESYAYPFHKDIKNYVKDALLCVYPQFANTKIDYGWGGTLAITMTRMPYFLAKDNVYSVSGYSGHGVGMATFAGKLLANKIHHGNDEDFDLYKKYPQLPFPGFGKFQHPILVLGMLYYSLRDKF